MGELKQQAVRIIEKLRREGHQAYLVGGCVRDLLLGREPADYDVTTDATPEQVMRIFPETYAVGAQFGVVLVPAAHTGHQALPVSTDHSKSDAVEVATFRSDVGYTDGRHPDQVRFSKDPKTDVERRDFTINGLLLDPVSEEVLDYVDGRQDLSARVIRTIGDPERRFAEDKLRMLRAVRFAARFGYEIEPATFAAMQKHAQEIHLISHERVRDELTKMLTEGSARRAFLLLDESGLLKQVLPEISAMKGVEQPPQFHPEGDVFVHTLLLLDKLPQPASATLAWGALLHDVGKPPTFRVADRIRFDGHVEVGVKMARNILHRLRFSNDDCDQILTLVENHMKFGDVQRMKDSTFKKFVRIPGFDEHLALHRLDCLSSHADLTSYNFTREKMAAIPPETIQPPPLITGNDLIQAGYAPGPLFKEILAVIEDGQLENRLSTREQAMELVRRRYPLNDRH